MKHLFIKVVISILFFSTFSLAADTLFVAPCDKAAINMFGDLICLSQETGTLRRYVNSELQDIYQSDENTSTPILQDPGQPVFDGADLIYLLDKGGQRIFGWDRYLNIHSITSLDEDMVSPDAFTVTSEHDWLIYDEFYGHIIQVHPGDNFYSGWGDEPVSGDIELFAVGDHVIIHLIDRSMIRISDVNGTTINTYSLPGSINIKNVFPLQNQSFALSSPNGVYIWKPRDDSLRYLSIMKNPIHCSNIKNGYRLISQEGMIVTIP